MGDKRKGQKRNFKDNKFGWEEERCGKRMTSGAQTMSPASVLVKRQDQGAKGRGVLGVREDLEKESDRR